MMDKAWQDVSKLIDQNEIDEAAEYCNALNGSEFQRVEQKLIDYLKSTDDNSVRNTIALLLSDLKSNDAIEPLIQLIKTPSLKDARATLIYALQNLDCPNRIVELFDILYDGNYESRCNLSTLLEEKVNEMDTQDVKTCKNNLKEHIIELEETLGLLYDIGETVFKMKFEE